MKLWTMKTLVLAALCLIFLGVGYKLGEVRIQAQTRSSVRFEKLSDSEALDTWTGKKCSLIIVPSGLKLDGPEPTCSSL